MVKPMLIDKGFDLVDIGVALGATGSVAGLAGALLGGLWLNRLGRFNALMIFGILQAVAVSAWVIIALGVDGIVWVYGLSVMENFVAGLATAALFTLMMDHCRSVCAGSDYTIQASIVVCVSILGAVVSGISAGTVGYALHFCLAGVMGLFALPFIYRYRYLYQNRVGVEV
mgnify:CR=1 FL=1